MWLKMVLNPEQQFSKLGRVLSPILFSYTSGITCNDMALLKYAEDMDLVAHLTDSLALRRDQWEPWPKPSLNADWTKELSCMSEGGHSQYLFHPLQFISGQTLLHLAFSQHALCLQKKDTKVSTCSENSF